jgi:hypothetical protein
MRVSLPQRFRGAGLNPQDRDHLEEPRAAVLDMAGGGSPGVVDGETPENRLVAIASYIAAGKRSEALAEIENLDGPFTDPEQLTRFMHLCLTLAGEELLDGNRTNGLRLIETCVYSGGPFGTGSGCCRDCCDRGYRVVPHEVATGREGDRCQDCSEYRGRRGAGVG